MDASPSPRPEGHPRRSPVLPLVVGVGVAALVVGAVGLVADGAAALGFGITVAAGAAVLLAGAVGWLMRRTGGTTGPFA